MAEKKKRKSAVSSAAASAVATVTAAGVLVGGAYSSPEEILSDGQDAIVQTLVSNGIQADDGDAPDAAAEDAALSGEDEKRGVHAAVRKHLRGAPIGVRAAVLLPLWGLGTVVNALASALWSTLLSPAAAAVLSWLGIALMAALIFALTVKSVFPELPLKKILNRRSLIGIGILCLICGIADAALPFFWEDYERLSRLLKLLGSFVCTGVPVFFFLRRRQRKRKLEEIEAETVEPELPREPTMEEREAAARALVEELADSVSRRAY